MKPEDPLAPVDSQDKQQSPMQQAQRKVISPVSSEQSILAEAAMSAPVAQATPAPQSLPDASPATTQVDTGDDNSYSGSLITERLHSSRPANNYPAVGASKPLATDDTPKPRHSAWKGIVGLIVLVGVGAYCYLTFFSAQIFAHDLVEEKTQNTSYLRPRQWSKIGNSAVTASAFGNMKGDSGKSTAAVSVQVDTQHQQTLTTEADAQRFRAQFLSLIDESSSAHFFQSDGVMCTTPIELTKKEDTTTTDTLHGMYYFTAACTRTNEKQKTEVRSRAVLGKDGYFRSISVVATEDLWEQNEEIFEKILSSLNSV